MTQTLELERPACPICEAGMNIIDAGNHYQAICASCGNQEFYGLPVYNPPTEKGIDPMTHDDFFLEVQRHVDSITDNMRPAAECDFARAARKLERDVNDYIASKWQSEKYPASTPQRAMEVIIEEIIVMIHTAAEMEIEENGIARIILACLAANRDGLIESAYHAGYWNSVESDLQEKVRLTTAGNVLAKRPTD